MATSGFNRFRMATYTEGRLVVRDNAFLSRLIHDPAKTLAELSAQYADVTHNDVDIDEYGRVVFASASFASAVMDAANEGGGAVTNNQCHDQSYDGSQYNSAVNNRCYNIYEETGLNQQCGHFPNGQ